jgi:uncharacterized protein (TIGR00255 family)
MTGYGKGELELSNSSISIELKSLNSKQLDLSSRLPYAFSDKEIELRSIIAKQLERGKISVYINRENMIEANRQLINVPLAKQYYTQIQHIADELAPEKQEDILAMVMRIPEVVKQSKEEIEENDWNQIINLVHVALGQLDDFRMQEGAVLEQDFRMRIASILELLIQVEQFEPLRITKVKERIQQLLDSQIEEPKIDKNRLEQELIYYIEKLDITEEKVRLKKHCDYFIETLDESVISKGKKLGFILQEIGREINTLGSKSNDSDMQRIVVQMKDELEKLKEQSLNIL